MKKLMIAAAAVLVSVMLSGCGAGTNGKTYVQSRVDNVFDGAEYVKKGGTEKTSSYYSCKYIFSYKDIEFTVTESQSPILEFGPAKVWDKQVYSSDYGRNLREFLTEEKLAELSGGVLDENKLWVDPSGDSQDVEISYRVASVDELPAVVQAYKDIYGAVWEYLPENDCTLEEGTTAFLPNVRFWLSVPSDDAGNYNLPEDNLHHWDSGYIPVMSFYCKADVIDWEEVETLVRYKYFTVNDFMAGKGIKSPVEMSDEDKKLIERNDNSFYPVYYAPASNRSPRIDEMTKDIPEYKR